MRKIFYFLNIFILAILFNSCSGLDNQQTSEEVNPQKWNYFQMYVNTDEITHNKDMVMINKFRNELGLDLTYDSSMKSYVEDFQWRKFQLVANFSSQDTRYQYIVVGDYNSGNVEMDKTALRYDWSELSKDVQKWLKDWTGKNKINRDIKRK